MNNRIDQVVYDKLVREIISLPTTEQSNFINHNLPNITNSKIYEKLTKLLDPLEEQSSVTSTCTIAASQPGDSSLLGDAESDG
ncbi:MAG: hypothetical protein LN588_05625 [Rickettsia endosymbiont of Bryobia graminum]|nr:hypothetical protein [Rickettsia endosymbiont of Bryobia graminum]